MYQHKEVDGIKKQLNKEFENIVDWFVDSKVSINFGVDKTKLILFSRKRRSKNVHQVNIKHKHVNIKHLSQVRYLGYVLDETMIIFSHILIMRF